jgi:hypothetical protein
MPSLGDLIELLERSGLLFMGIAGLYAHSKRWWLFRPSHDDTVAHLERERTELRQLVVRSYQVEEAFMRSMGEVEAKVSASEAALERFEAALTSGTAGDVPAAPPPERAVKLTGEIGAQS